jgi:hypothetical protein
MNRSSRWLVTASLLAFLTACHKDADEPQKEEPEFEIGSCQGVAPGGHLTVSGSTYSYKTSGGGKIDIDLEEAITITHDDYTNFTIEFWGDTLVNGEHRTSGNHENLNGKHVKDRIGSRRTVIFPDGAKITFEADGRVGPIKWISIYDGAESHHINATCNTLEESLNSATVAQRLDDAEADGETGTFEITETGLLFKNIYSEDTPGNKVENVQPIGELDRENPNRVIDYFDDSDLGHT